MGRSSKSDRKSGQDDEAVVDNRHSSDAVRDQNGSTHSDTSTRKRHRHHHRDRIDNLGSEEREVVQTESDRHRGRKNHDKKPRRDRSNKRRYSSDNSASDNPKSKKNHHQKHRGRRIDGNDSFHEIDAKRKKRHRHSDVDDGKQKKRKKEISQAAVSSEPQTISIDKSKLYSLGEVLGHPPEVVLDPETDYFAQNQRFRIYLYRECGLTFDELSSHDARKKFKDFARQYNAGNLEEGYYVPHLPIEALEECPSTRHQWSLKITHHDSQNLQFLQEGVRKQTEYQATELNQLSSTDINKSNASHKNLAIATSKDQVDHNNGNVVIHRQHTEPNNRVVNRRLREHVQTTIEELTGGRKEGRERQLEKRQERAAKIHGASKYQQDMLELDDASLYGGNTDDDFRRLAAASRKRAAAQEAKKEERILELKQKEQDKQNAMLQMLGLSHKIGQSKIEIQPRNDPPESEN